MNAQRNSDNTDYTQKLRYQTTLQHKHKKACNSNQAHTWALIYAGNDDLMKHCV